MTANELRIGNLVTIDNEVWAEYRGKPMSVTMIDTVIQMGDKDLFPDSTGTVNLMYGDIDFGQYDEFIQPIPLTDEWLVKFGFEKDGTWFTKSGFGISIDNLKWQMKGYIATFDKCLYVHQLQNLYFALTGQDLN